MFVQTNMKVLFQYQNELFFIYIKNTILSYARRYNQMLEKTEGAIKNGQSRETGNIGYTIIRIVEI